MSAPPAIGWGVLGTGLTAHRFARDLRGVAGTELAAVCSRELGRAQAAAARMGAQQALQGRDALLACPEVEVVYVATPNHRHHADCLAGLAAGKHVLCEKPLAMTASEAREIEAAARAAGRFCMEGLWTHFLPAVEEAARLVEEGRIGAPRLLAASFGLPGGGPPRREDGGALHDRGCYPVSLALRLFGSPTGVTGAALPGPDGADAAASATLTFAGGEVAQLGVSLCAQLDNRLWVGGDGGFLALDELPCPTALTLRPATAAAGVDEGDSGLREAVRRAVRQSRPLSRLRRFAADRTRIWPCQGFGYTHEIAHVTRCLRDGVLQSPVHPLARSIATLEVIEAVARGGSEAFA